VGDTKMFREVFLRFARAIELGLDPLNVRHAKIVQYAARNP
jgi:hypothetical protein